MKIITTSVLEWDDKELTDILDEMAAAYDWASAILHKCNDNRYFSTKEEALADVKQRLLVGMEIELADFMYGCGFIGVQSWVKKSWMMESLTREETKTEEGSF